MRNKRINNFEPKLVLETFMEYCKIPHPSKHEEGVRQFCLDFLTKNNIEFTHASDKLGNTVINIPASKDFEHKPIVGLQAHLDMVAVKESGMAHDFLTDAIDVYEENGWLKANGTTLGADNGIGVALILAYVVEQRKTHGPLELIFTVQEENGIQGMAAFKIPLNAKYLINIDGEHEQNNAIALGCLGGNAHSIRLQPKLEKIKPNSVVLELSIDGLLGGHSGIHATEIRLNAIKTCFQILEKVSQKYHLNLISVDGGSSYNSIATYCSAVFSVEKEDSAQIQKEINEESKSIISAFKDIEKNANYTLKKINAEYSQCFDKASTNKIIKAISLMQSNIIIYNKVHEILELACNVGLIKWDEIKKELDFRVQVRGLNADRMECFVSFYRSQLENLGFITKKVMGYYPWEPKIQSKTNLTHLLQVADDATKKLFNKPAIFFVVPGGLEMSYVSERYPQMELMALSTNILDAHAVTERVQISSINDCYSLLKEVLKNI